MVGRILAKVAPTVHPSGSMGCSDESHNKSTGRWHHSHLLAISRLIVAACRLMPSHVDRCLSYSKSPDRVSIRHGLGEQIRVSYQQESGPTGEKGILARNYFLIALTQECVLFEQYLHQKIDVLRLEVFICTQVTGN